MGKRCGVNQRDFVSETQNRLRKVFLYSVATPRWLPHAKGSLPRRFNGAAALGRLSRLINGRNTSANVNFAGFPPVPNAAAFEVQLVLTSLCLEPFSGLLL